MRTNILKKCIFIIIPSLLLLACGSDKPTGTVYTDIVTNQVGYRTNSEKIAIFHVIPSETEFSVINAKSKKTVYSGTIYTKDGDNSKVYGDFSAVTDEGKYYITCGELDKSYTFQISDDVYDALLEDSVRMLYFQRCGTELEDKTFGHMACHTSQAIIYGTNEKLDVTGGWHDAGDYGRYVVPSAKAVGDLLYAYAANPELFCDDTGIPENGNEIPDILDEVRYELEWLLKMQTPNGGVYHKVTCMVHPGYIMPEEEAGPLLVTPVSTTATADFCAVMAMAYEFYFEVDQAFAEKCLSAADKAWSFLEANPQFIFDNPTDITTGTYDDTYDKDERYWAAAQMYRATGKDIYLNALQQMSPENGLGWMCMGDYGNIAILTMEHPDCNSQIYINAEMIILAQADQFLANTKETSYGVGLTSFHWGSNMNVANAGIYLELAYDLTGKEEYHRAAESNLNYLLGQNPNEMCYVTGYGTRSPQNPHHRPSLVKEHPVKGMLVGGVNSDMQDTVVQKRLAGKPAEECYIDHPESYSTNEITIYWNSSLTYLLTLTEK